jgi:MEMO1 family protein
MKREMSVSGSFYPDTKKELERYFAHFNQIDKEKKSSVNVKSRAVIVPHAGYVYSGYTANLAYKVLANAKIKNLVVIGPSHRVAFEGVSLCGADVYDTPFGEILSAQTLVKEIREKFHLQTLLQAHAEHSTEVQFPFIKHYLDGVNIVELVYGRATPQEVSQIINFVLEDEQNSVVISTDLSHFYTLKEANEKDNLCLNAIEKLDINLLESGCEACGKIGVGAMLLSAKKLALKAHILDYKTSANASGDTSRVVGYMSAYFD